MLIGLGYKARSGKDTVANILERDHYFRRFAFADTLKAACAQVFSFSSLQLYGGEKEKADPFWGVTPREVLQRVGTECFRKGFSEDIWIRALHRRILERLESGVNTAITDVRYPNEAQAILDWGGYLVRIDRPGAGASGGVQNHPSETSLDTWTRWDAVLLNNGTLEDLEAGVQALVKTLAAKGTL